MRLPVAPPTADRLYQLKCEEKTSQSPHSQSLDRDSGTGFLEDASVEISAVAAKSVAMHPSWDTLQPTDRGPFEAEAIALHERYQEEYRAFIERSDRLQL